MGGPINYLDAGWGDPVLSPPAGTATATVAAVAGTATATVAGVAGTVATATVASGFLGVIADAHDAVLLKASLQYPSDPILAGGEEVDSVELPEDAGGEAVPGEAPEPLPE